MSYPTLLTPEEKLADAKKRMAIPAIVVICGSTRFMAEMTEADVRETAAGKIVVKPGCNMKAEHPLWADPVEAEALKVRLDDLHRAKIRIADEVLVVGDYIGSSTTAEIAYARSLGKPIRFTHPEADPGEPGGDPAGGEPASSCGKCKQPFDPADRHFDGRARYGQTPYCRSCVGRCHDTEIADHRCVICA